MRVLYPYSSVLLCWQYWVYKSWHIFHIFVANITQKHCHFWSKFWDLCKHWPGLHIKHVKPGFESPPVTVPLLTFMYTKSYPVYDKYIHSVKTNILEQITHVSFSLRLVQQSDKGAGRSSRGVFQPAAKWVLETVNMPYFYHKCVVKSIL